ncbi:MAG: DUF2279 domain-containing protein [Cytophagaceae bacterium]|nr:DUF2279 domain-containing protein [Cytophagaceae bacterium]
MIGLRLLFISLLLFTNAVSLHAQSTDSTNTFKPKRFTALATTAGVTYTGSLVLLGSIWYTDQLSTNFKFFNDDAEWKGMDKLGHLYTSFHVSNAAVRVLKWTGSSRKKSILFGGFTGTVLMLPIEVLDGFSNDYGFSWGDVTANTSGSILAVTQHLLWDEIRITPKFSYHETGYADMRPNALGATTMQRFIKDYNGQTYWLSFNIASLAHLKRFPKWLNVSAGYSAEEMLYALHSENSDNGYHSYAKGLLSLDIDFNRIKTKHAFLRGLFRGLNMLHIPFPALEYNGRNGFQFHPLYF